MVPAGPVAESEASSPKLTEPPLPEVPPLAGAPAVPAVELLASAGECPELPRLARDASGVPSRGA